MNLWDHVFKGNSLSPTLRADEATCTLFTSAPVTNNCPYFINKGCWAKMQTLHCTQKIQTTLWDILHPNLCICRITFQALQEWMWILQQKHQGKLDSSLAFPVILEEAEIPDQHYWDKIINIKLKYLTWVLIHSHERGATGNFKQVRPRIDICIHRQCLKLESTLDTVCFGHHC